MLRKNIRNLQDIPDIVRAIEKKLLLLGIREPLHIIRASANF